MPGLAEHSPGSPKPAAHPGATVTPLRPVSRHAPPAEFLEEAQVAAFWEGIFRRQGRTLSDADTADVHRITAATLGLLIEGAHTDGALTDQAAAYLTGLVEAAVRAPDHC